MSTNIPGRSMSFSSTVPLPEALKNKLNANRKKAGLPPLGVQSKDKMIDMSNVEDAVITESTPKETTPKATTESLKNIDETLRITEEELGKALQESESQLEKKVDPPSFIEISQTEYTTIAKTMQTIANLKKLESLTGNKDAEAQINFLEMSVWDDLAKKFGFSSVEAMSSERYSFGLKTVFGLECRKKE